MSEALRKAAEQALKAWEQGLGHLARDTLKTALSETEQPPRLSDEQIDDCDVQARISFKRQQRSVVGQQIMPSDGFDWHFARAIETAVRRQFLGRDE